MKGNYIQFIGDLCLSISFDDIILNIFRLLMLSAKCYRMLSALISHILIYE